MSPGSSEMCRRVWAVFAQFPDLVSVPQPDRRIRCVRVSAAADRLLPAPADKSALPLPRERPTSIDLPQVAHVPMDAGDVLRKGDRPTSFLGLRDSLANPQSVANSLPGGPGDAWRLQV